MDFSKLLLRLLAYAAMNVLVSILESEIPPIAILPRLTQSGQGVIDNEGQCRSYDPIFGSTTLLSKGMC